MPFLLLRERTCEMPGGGCGIRPLLHCFSPCAFKHAWSSSSSATPQYSFFLFFRQWLPGRGQDYVLAAITTEGRLTTVSGVIPTTKPVSGEKVSASFITSCPCFAHVFCACGDCGSLGRLPERTCRVVTVLPHFVQKKQAMQRQMLILPCVFVIAFI